MSEIIQFIPKSELTANENLSEFIHFSRNDLTVFETENNTFDWTENSWKGEVNFTKIGAHSRQWNEEDLLDSSIIEFAKAYYRYQQGINKTKNKNEIKALRCIEAALLNENGKCEIYQASPATFDKAAQIARDKYSKLAAYQAGGQLVKLNKFLNEYSLTSSPFIWKNPNKKPAEETLQIGEEAAKKRTLKLPDEEALLAVAEIFNLYPNLPERSILATSVVAILLAVPARITEVLSLAVDCIHYDVDKDGNPAVGLRWYSQKGYGHEIKWIPSSMVSIVEEAIVRVKKLTDPARKLALWYENNPELFPRHKNCPNVTEDELLSLNQVALAIGLGIGKSNKQQRTNARQYLKRYKLDTDDYKLSLRMLNQHLRMRLPNSFPLFNEDAGTEWSNALFALREEELSKQIRTSPLLLLKPDATVINSALGPRKIKYHHSIFSLHGYDPELKLKSHQPRHKLNTDARLGGMTDTVIAKWSGRADEKQNRHYNHVSPEQMIDLVKSVNSELTIVGEHSVNLPLTYEEYQLMAEGKTAHVTEGGFCVHDYISSPCQKFMDCINCSEHVCVKGNDQKLSSLILQLERETALLNKAKMDIENDFYGADKWYLTKLRTVERLQELISILKNKSIQDGAVVRLHVPDEHTPLNRAIESSQDSGLFEKKAQVDSNRNTINNNTISVPDLGGFKLG